MMQENKFDILYIIHIHVAKFLIGHLTFLREFSKTDSVVQNKCFYKLTKALHFPAGDYRAAINRHDSINNKKDP